MKIDMHVHVVGRGGSLENAHEEVYFRPEDNQHWFTRILYHLLDEDLERMGGDLDENGTISTDEYSTLVCRLLASSEELDAVVLLGLDAVYSPRTGELDERRTDLWVSNRFLHKRVSQLNTQLEAMGGARKRFFMGASVSPNNARWADELTFVLQETEAVLVKLIPSVQHIRMMDSRHDEFFDRLAQARMPLLCHIGPEYAFPEGIRQSRLDDFRLLQRALDRGVTVIAAHCGTPVFPVIDRQDVREFHAFMQEANSGGQLRLYSDTSALSMTTRIPQVPRILDLFPPEQLLHGSDFPIPIEGWAHLPYLTNDVKPKEYLGIVRTKNPLDRDVRIKRAMGFSDGILGNAEGVLRLPSD
jgi:predicted TIM-barrel fold metal-dependent hydrolase